MKFGKQLRYECVPEWRSKYVSYGKLKKYLRYLYTPVTANTPPDELRKRSKLSGSPILAVPVGDEKQPLINSQQQSISQPPQLHHQPQLNIQSQPSQQQQQPSQQPQSSQQPQPQQISQQQPLQQQPSQQQPQQISQPSQQPQPQPQQVSQQQPSQQPQSSQQPQPQQVSQQQPSQQPQQQAQQPQQQAQQPQQQPSLQQQPPQHLQSSPELQHHFQQSHQQAPQYILDGTDSRHSSFGKIDMKEVMFVDETHTFLKATEKERLFFNKINEELKKINEFFILKEKDLILHYNKLTEHASMILKDQNPNPKLLKSIHRAFLEIYQGLTMLENFVNLNHTGFSKILKKFDRMTSRSIRENHMSLIEKEVFYSSKIWKNMKEDVELLFCKIFKIDKLATARHKLRPVSMSNSTDWHMMKLGLAIGASLSALAFIIILFISGPVGDDPDWGRFVSVVPIFRGVGIPILAVWLWGVCVFIWEKARVNYILIFGFDPRTTVDSRRIFKTASALTSIWLFTYLLFCGTIMGNFKFLKMPAQVYPLALVIFFLVVVFFPFRFFHRKSRLMLFKTLGNVIITPFGSTKFRALFLGDVLTSMVKTIFDWEYTACYFFTGDWITNNGARCTRVNNIALPIISGLPLLWRMMQCAKLYSQTKRKLHLGNTSKYAVGFTVVLFSALNGNYSNYPEPWTPGRILWCICFILATLYMYTWDVLVDWRLMWMGSPRPLLRQHLIYKKYIWSYYYVIFSNFIFRFAWTLTVTPLEFNIGINPELFVTILATVELFRRFTWAIFRVENEHVQNSLQYHAFDLSDAPWSGELKKSIEPMDISNSAQNLGGASPATTDGGQEFGNSKNWKFSANKYYSKNNGWVQAIKDTIFTRKRRSNDNNNNNDNNNYIDDEESQSLINKESD